MSSTSLTLSTHTHSSQSAYHLHNNYSRTQYGEHILCVSCSARNSTRGYNLCASARAQSLFRCRRFEERRLNEGGGSNELNIFKRQPKVAWPGSATPRTRRAPNKSYAHQIIILRIYDATDEYTIIRIRQLRRRSRRRRRRVRRPSPPLPPQCRRKCAEQQTPAVARRRPTRAAARAQK